MDNEKIPIIDQNFFCEICNYKTNNKKDYKKHLLTKKHLKTEENNKNTNLYIKKFFNCKCGKKYMHSSGLSKHKKICDNYQENNIINLLLKENKEMKEIIKNINLIVVDILREVTIHNAAKI